MFWTSLLIKSRLFGWSLAAYVNKFECSICKKDYKLCNQHQAGKIYNGLLCESQIQSFKGQHIAFVPEPSYSQALVTYVLIIEDRKEKNTDGMVSENREGPKGLSAYRGHFLMAWYPRMLQTVSLDFQ